MFALRSPRLGRRVFLLSRLRHDLAAAAASHPDIIQRVPGSAHAVAGKRWKMMVLLTMMPSVLLHFNLQ